MSDTEGVVRDDRTHNRFVLDEDGATGRLEYITEPGRLILVHTEVPEALGGRGIGGRLIATAVKRAEAEGETIVPWCPFARRWLHEHAEQTAGIDIDFKTPPPGA